MIYFSLTGFLSFFCEKKFYLFGLGVIAFLGGCSILPESAPQQIYQLPSYKTTVAEGGMYSSNNISLRVRQPYANRFLNTTYVAVQSNQAELAVYKGIRWTDPVPILLRDRLIQEFRRNNDVGFIVSDEDNARVRYEVGSDIVAFQGVYHPSSSKGEVWIRLDAYLTYNEDGRVIARRTFDVRQPIAGKSMDEVVQAFGLATDQLSEQFQLWVLQQAR